MKLIVKLIGWIFLLIIILLILWLGIIFGPMFHISYNDCIDKTEKNITDNARIYEVVPMKGSSIIRQSTPSDKYDKPFLCIENHRIDDLCHINMELGKYRLKKIEAQKVKLTGRVVKQYSFNAFNNDMYTLEVVINNKKYLVSHWEYDDMTIKDPIQKYEKRFKEPTCSIFK